MELRGLSASAIEILRDTFRAAQADQDLLERCWKKQTCGGCLATPQCSWCPYTWSCVANTYKIPLLAPAYDDHICPHKQEQWEVRTHPFGCHASSVTTLTAIISIISTVVLALIITFLIVGYRRIQRYSKNNPQWWPGLKRRCWRVLTWRSEGEREPLLPAHPD